MQWFVYEVVLEFNSSCCCYYSESCRCHSTVLDIAYHLYIILAQIFSNKLTRSLTHMPSDLHDFLSKVLICFWIEVLFLLFFTIPSLSPNLAHRLICILYENSKVVWNENMKQWEKFNNFFWSFCLSNCLE